jgi:Zn-dependent M28 family amino/carboxypeptidase
MRRILVLAALPVALLAAVSGQSRRVGPLPLDAIEAGRVTAHLRFLAHDLLEGRAPGTRGGSLAAQYIAAQFAAAGLAPAGEDGTFFQDVPMVQTAVAPGFTLTAARPGGPAATPVSYAYPSDVVAFSDLQREEVAVRAEAVFVGYGIVAPEYRWNDYAGADVKGRIVVVMVNDPPATATEPQLFAGTALTYYGRWTYKFEEAARQGAAGAILIHTTESASYPWQVVESSWTGTQYALPVEAGRPVLAFKAWMTEAAARSLVRLAGEDLEALRGRASSRGFRAVPLPVTVAGTIHQAPARRVSPNVIGLVRGVNDREAVIYTAHYDHFGIKPAPAGEAAQPEDRIFNGAQDNASGVAGIIAVADAFARAPSKPGRSIYFVATTGEESGLLGSEYLAAHPPLPLDRVAAVINVDSLNLFGRTHDIVLLGSERSSLGETAAAIARAHGRAIGRELNPGAGSFFRSDHFPLARGGVPALSISAPGEYVGKDPGFARRLREEYTAKRYHQPGDEVDPAWDYAGAIEDLRLLAELGWRVAAAPAMPAYKSGDEFARPRAGRTPGGR